ncbi:MAG: endonuclease/exonuclease/phosphatase family protein [Planctomycetota bacterium]
MLARLSILCFLACCTLSLGQEVATPAKAPQQDDKVLTRDHRLRIASWNMLNLFDNFDEPNKPDEGTPPKSFAEMQFLAKAIDDLDADILGVQEVENRAVLEALNAHLKRPFVYVELIEGNDHRGIDVGLLSRLPVVRAASHRQLDLETNHRFARDFPLFRVQIAKGEFIEVGVLHLKSKRGKASESNAWRRAEADGIRRIVARQRKLEPKVPVVIMGDFNDTREAKTLEPIFATFNDPTKIVPAAERYSFSFRGNREQIDFILGLGMPRADKAYFLQRADSPSDHSPVIVDFAVTSTLKRLESPALGPPKAPKRPRIKAKDLASAKKHFLQEVEIEGIVVKVHHYKGGAAALNFDRDHASAVVVYVPKEAVARIGKVDDLIGKNVKVRGPISKHRRTYQIRLTRPSQLDR